MFTFDNEKNNLIKKISTSNNTILITGETGTGKTYLAEKIHNYSERRNQKFVAVNLATLNENLIESELFGHEKGAFSGATQKRIGKFELGNSGTILLDEVGEISLGMQARLLEALNSKTICPVGSNREIKLDIRFIIATNKNLRDMVNSRLFRSDLYYRINTFQIELPAIKICPDQIEVLAKNFLREAKPEAIFSQDCMEVIKQYEWPGNVRELKNAIYYTAAVSETNEIHSESLPKYLFNLDAGSQLNTPFPVNYYEAKNNFEKNYLQFVLKRFEGKINVTSRESQLSKVTLIEKIRKYNINVNLLKLESLHYSNPNKLLNYSAK